MKRQAQPNKWSCLPTAFAMMLDVDVQSIFDWLKHDGSEVWFPEYDHPYDTRSFHIQEMVDYAWVAHRRPVILIEASPAIQSRDGGTVKQLPIPESRMESYLVRDGVLVGENREGKAHAVAWHDGLIYDPAGDVVYDRRHFTIWYFAMIA